MNESDRKRRQHPGVDLPHLRQQVEASRDYVFTAAGIPQVVFSAQ